MLLFSARRGDEGFTLVELLIVIAIIGVLAAIAIPIFLSQVDKADRAGAEAELNSAYKMLITAEIMGDTLPASLNAGVPANISDLGTITPTNTITVTGSNDTLCLETTLSNGDTLHRDAGTIADGPCPSGGGGGGGGGGTTFTYGGSTVTFTRGSNNQTITPTTSGLTGTPTYTVTTGTLPANVTLNPTTGELTGPATGDWTNQAVSISNGRYFSCAVTGTGGIQCWGSNGDGQLGDGTTTDALSPVTVTGLASAATQVATGRYHTCALLDTGAVQCWGYNADGQLGTGNFATTSTPTAVVGLTAPATSITAGEYHTCVTLNDGTAQCWGYNSDGQLGNELLVDSATAVAVQDLGANVTAISAGSDYTCALLNDGTAQCWGYNSSGQLGNNSTTESLTAVDVDGLTSGVSAIEAGAYHTCAILNDTSLQYWGYNSDGQIGNNSTTDALTPVTVSSGVTAVSAGADYTCAVLSDGTARCWGYNNSGDLGTGDGNSYTTPTPVVDMTTAVAISAGTDNTCAVLSDGTAQCWGYGGELGDGTSDSSSSPVDVLGFNAQPGFPSTITITATDGSTTIPTTITIN